MLQFIRIMKNSFGFYVKGIDLFPLFTFPLGAQNIRKRQNVLHAHREGGIMYYKYFIRLLNLHFLLQNPLSSLKTLIAEYRNANKSNMYYLLSSAACNIFVREARKLCIAFSVSTILQGLDLLILGGHARTKSTLITHVKRVAWQRYRPELNSISGTTQTTQEKMENLYFPRAAQRAFRKTHTVERNGCE